MIQEERFNFQTRGANFKRQGPQLIVSISYGIYEDPQETWNQGSVCKKLVSTTNARIHKTMIIFELSTFPKSVP